MDRTVNIYLTAINVKSGHEAQASIRIGVPGEEADVIFMMRAVDEQNTYRRLEGVATDMRDTPIVKLRPKEPTRGENR